MGQQYDVIGLDDDGQEVILRQVWRDTPPNEKTSKRLANGRLAVRPRRGAVGV